MTDDLEELAQRFRHQSESAAPRAPLYVGVCAVIADDPELVGLMRHAANEQRQPVLLLAAIHALVLEHPDSVLAQWYPNVSSAARSPDERGPLGTALRRFCADHADALAELLGTRSTQTNEVGRCALFVPVFSLIENEVGAIAHVDVGASAGLNLLWRSYTYRYEPGGSVGAPSPVVLECGTRGDVPVPAALPDCASIIGLDREPIDVTDESQARWLEACVWPDQGDRFERLRAALALARDDPPVVYEGDAVRDVAARLGAIAADGHPVVTNTWVLNYLTGDERRAYVDELDEFGARQDLTWVFIEMPSVVPELPVAEVLADEKRRNMSILTIVRWRRGERSVEHAATCHPHGYWMHWQQRPPTATVGGRQP